MLPGSPPPLLQIMHEAVAAHRSGRFDEAERLYRRVLRSLPDQFDALHLLGVLEGQRGRHAKAERLIKKALRINPNSAEAHNNLGNVFWQAKRFSEAEAAYERSLAIQPNFVPAISNRGNVLRLQGRFEEALAAHDQALALSPQYVEALSNRGDVLHDLRRYDEALSMYDKALALSPRSAQTAINRGVLLRDLMRLPEALTMLERARAIEPRNPAANFNESLCRLVIGDFEKGWAGYEWRWELDGFRSVRRDFSKPLWRGKEDLSGKTILLHSEQGLGDTIQFCRYATMVAARGARVILEVQPPLRSLLAGLRGVALVLTRGERLPAFDLHSPLLSLPLAFGTTLQTIPAETPYLAADPERTAAWRRRLELAKGLKVGLAWAGASRRDHPRAHIVDQRRSLHLRQFAPLAAVEDVVFVSLQKDEPASQLPSAPAGLEILDWTAELHDFNDTAALVAALDLVISVDTSVAHLAGALAKPVWLLNRFDTDFRWLRDREDSPWYPTLRLFRQRVLGDWSGVMERVAAELATLAAADRH